MELVSSSPAETEAIAARLARLLAPGDRFGEAVAGTVNLLCSDRLSDLGAGATYQSTFLDVKRAARV